MRRIVVMAPMTVELRPVAAALGLRRGVGRAGETEVRAVLAGVGPAAAAERTDQVLRDWSPEVVAVVGIAGGIGEEIRIGDVVVPEVVIDHATSERFIPRTVPLVRRRNALVTTEGLAPAEELEVRRRADGVVAVDMETAAVARVCDAAGVGWFAVRGISDLVGEGLVDDTAMTMLRPDGTIDAAAAARTVLRHPAAAARMVRLGRDTVRAMSVAAATLAAVVAAVGRGSG